MLDQLEGRWNIEVEPDSQNTKKSKNRHFSKLSIKKVLSGGPSGFDPMFLCDKGEFTHATIEGEASLKMFSQKTISLSGLPSGTGVKNTFLYQTWKVSI